MDNNVSEKIRFPYTEISTGIFEAQINDVVRWHRGDQENHEFDAMDTMNVRWSNTTIFDNKKAAP